MAYRRHSLKTLLLVAFSALTVAGCATALPGIPEPGEPDVRTLETGDFPTHPARLGALMPTEMARLEAARMAGAVLSPHEVDPRYSIGASARLLPNSAALTDYLPPAVISVVTRRGFVTGFTTGCADAVVPLTRAAQGTRDRDGLTVTVLRFPDTKSAASAAQEMDTADAALNPDNVAVSLPKYQDSRAHWRPAVPTLGSTTAHGVYVLNILADSRTTDLPHLVDATQKYLDAEIPELDRFTPTPRSDFVTLSQDPDRMLSRTLHTSGWIPGPDDQGEIVYSLRGYLNFVQDQESRLPILRKAGVDSVAVTPTAILFRTADDRAARQFVIDSAGLGDAVNRRDVDPPDGVPNTRCVEDYVAPVAARFRCFVAYQRFSALVLGQRLWETQQQAAAQYALLANTA